MKKICVYTVITGDYDNVNEIKEKENNIDYYLFTNNKKIESKTWNVIYIENEGLNDQLLSRKIKMLGHEEINNKYDIYIYQDGPIKWIKPIKEFLKKYLKENNFLAFKHSMRKSVKEEAIECLKVGLDKKEKIVKTLKFLEKEKFPDNIGLCEMTVFIYRNDEKVKNTMKDWFYMVSNYSKRDQLTFMYCVWKNKLKIDKINLKIWDNIYFEHTGHKKKTGLKTCRIYYGEKGNYDYHFDDHIEYKKDQKTYSCKTSIKRDCNSIEIVLTDVPMVGFRKLKIKGVKYNNLKAINNYEYDNYNIFYSDWGIIRLEGDFKENQELELTTELKAFDSIEASKIVCSIVDSNEKIKNENQETIFNLRNELYKIYHSKGWTLLTKLRKFNIFKK